MKKALILLVICTVCCYQNAAFSQGFVEDIVAFPTIGDGCRIIKSDGAELTGTWLGWTGTMKKVSTITFKSDDGEKLKFEPSDVTRMYIKQSNLVKFAMLADKSYLDNNFTNGNSEAQKKIGIISKMVENWEEMMLNETELIYEFVEEKAGKFGLRQMINPGFDEKYRVFMFGYNYNKLVLLNSNGEKKMLTSDNYAEEFKNAFGDCTEFIEIFGGDISNDDYKNVANHIFMYSNFCKE